MSISDTDDRTDRQARGGPQANDDKGSPGGERQNRGQRRGRRWGRRQLPVTVTAYFLVSIFCVIFDEIYALFGHGVRSDAMSHMYRYPLLGGALVFGLIWLLVRPNADFRINRFAFNAYNSGIAALTLGSLLRGVVEIAGSDSNYLLVLPVAGWLMVAAGVVAGVADWVLRRKPGQHKSTR